MSALWAAGHPAVPRAAHRQERDVREQDAGGAEDAADQDHQHLLSGHAPAGLLHRHQVSGQWQWQWHSTVHTWGRGIVKQEPQFPSTPL